MVYEDSVPSFPFFYKSKTLLKDSFLTTFKASHQICALPFCPPIKKFLSLVFKDIEDYKILSSDCLQFFLPEVKYYLYIIGLDGDLCMKLTEAEKVFEH